MRKILSIFFGFFLISIFSPAAGAQELFDSYGMISVTEERARLDNFAFSLEQNTEHLGYIVVQAPKKNMPMAIKRAIRAQDYLICKRKIAKGRVIVAKSDRIIKRVEFILQPVPPNSQLPKEWRPLR